MRARRVTARGDFWLRWSLFVVALTAVTFMSAAVRAQPPAGEPRGEAADPAEDPPEDDAPPEDPVVSACLSSFDKSQSLRRENKLIEAKVELVACSQQSCPDVVVVKCQEWLEAVKVSMPSVVVTAMNEGVDVFDVQVFVDGKLTMPTLDGTAVELDIGPRHIRVVRGGVERQRTVLVSEGVKNRIVSFVFAPPKPPPPSPTLIPLPDPPPKQVDEGLPISVLSIVSFSVAVAGGVVGTVTGILAIDMVASLEGQCPGEVCPAFTADEFGPTAAMNHASTVGFSVAGAGLVLGVIGLFIDPDGGPVEVTQRGLGVRF